MDGNDNLAECLGKVALVRGGWLPAPGMPGDVQRAELRHAEGLRDGPHGVRRLVQVQVKVAVESHVGRKYCAKEPKTMSQLTQRGLRGLDYRLRPHVFARRTTMPSERNLLQRIVLVRHVTDAQNVLPRLAWILRVEGGRLLLHCSILGHGELLLHLVIRALWDDVGFPVPDWPQVPALGYQPLRIPQVFPGIDDLHATGAPSQHGPQLRHEAADAVLDPRALGVCHDQASAAQGASLSKAAHKGFTPLVEDTLLL
mmetsp:Transcript_28336/g.64164  ORF Transcript_28336/g.64164 Transcript_28336/m.64164 type:complete len:256 (-) Transcript_28336:555-1322(-)